VSLACLVRPPRDFSMHPFFVSTASVAAGELGDKTQLLSLILAARLRKPVPIIAGIFVATLVNHLIACSVGEWAGSLVTPAILCWVLGISFLAVAVWALIPDKMDENIRTQSTYGVFALMTVTFFLAEMGDKTQIGSQSGRQDEGRCRPPCGDRCLFGVEFLRALTTLALIVVVIKVTPCARVMTRRCATSLLGGAEYLRAVSRTAGAWS
jgi:hypothetical protein